MTMTSPMDVRPACGRRAAVRFLSFTGLVWVCEIKLFHMGKTKGNPYLVCENECFHMIKNSGNPNLVCNNYFPPMATQTRSRSDLTKRWTKLRFLLFETLIVSLKIIQRSGPEVIKLFPCSTQLSTKVNFLINVKMPSIVGILTSISMINATSGRLKARNVSRSVLESILKCLHKSPCTYGILKNDLIL